jgi:hypothetical protein
MSPSLPYAYLPAKEKYVVVPHPRFSMFHAYLIQNGFDDRHRGQLMVHTGPKLCTGHELASKAAQVLDTTLKFEAITEAEARNVLKAQSDSDPSKLQYLLEYYSLAREGKTNYISATAFVNVVGTSPQEPEGFFKVRNFVNESSRKQC